MGIKEILFGKKKDHSKDDSVDKDGYYKVDPRQPRHLTETERKMEIHKDRGIG